MTGAKGTLTCDEISIERVSSDEVTLRFYKGGIELLKYGPITLIECMRFNLKGIRIELDFRMEGP